MKRALALVFVVALSLTWGGPLVAQGDSPETLLEQQRALEAETQPRTPGLPQLTRAGIRLGGELLFAGVDDPAIDAVVIDPTDNTTAPAFNGVDVWGAALIPGAMPGDAEVYTNDGADLYRWVSGAPPALCCTLMFNAATATVVSIAYDSNAGELLFTRNIATEAVYSLPVTPGACPVSCDLTQDIVYASGDNDFGGLAYDPATDTLYGTNDDGTPGPAGVYEINGDGTTSLVVAYPVGETDIDGLAFGNGNLYLVTDDAAGSIFVYDVVGATYLAPLTAPWPTSELFAGAAAGTGLIVPVELESFSVE